MPYQRPIYVLTACDKEEVDERKTGEFVNIEEDITGRDILTFVCAKCNTVHKSLRFGGMTPMHCPGKENCNLRKCTPDGCQQLKDYLANKYPPSSLHELQELIKGMI